MLADFQICISVTLIKRAPKVQEKKYVSKEHFM